MKIYILNLKLPWTAFNCPLENPALWLESRSWDGTLEITARKRRVVILTETFKTLEYMHGFEGNPLHVQTCKSVIPSSTTGCISCRCLGYVDLQSCKPAFSFLTRANSWCLRTQPLWYLLFTSASFCYLLSTRPFLVWAPIWCFFKGDRHSTWEKHITGQTSM